MKVLDPLDFSGKLEGREVHLVTLELGDICVQITNYGARLVALWTSDEKGRLADVVLGFHSLKAYIEAGQNYHGATVGRFANRLSNGRFELDGKSYSLAVNNAPNHLHGGEKGFESMVWTIDEQSAHSVSFSYRSIHMEEGYPGNLDVRVTYTLTDQSTLQIDYRAVTDQPTVLNLTNHAYFNLKGEGEGSILDHVLHISADHYTPLNRHQIPTGEVLSVAGTPFDFRQPIRIGHRIDNKHQQLEIGQGYDHNFVLAGTGSVASAATVWEPTTGRKLEVATDQPGMQLYTANFMDGSEQGKSGNYYQRRDAFCLETQHFPDSPNQPHFPSTSLYPGKPFLSTTCYRFGVKPISPSN